MLTQFCNMFEQVLLEENIAAQYIYIYIDRMCVGAGGLKLVNRKHLLAAAVNECLWQCKNMSGKN